MKLNYNPKYRIGDIVTIERVFTVKNHGSYDYSHGEIEVQILKISPTSLGYCYELKSYDNIDLGGVLYWENEIKKLIVTGNELEERMWKVWGDQ